MKEMTCNRCGGLMHVEDILGEARITSWICFNCGECVDPVTPYLYPSPGRKSSPGAS